MQNTDLIEWSLQTVLSRTAFHISDITLRIEITSHEWYFLFGTKDVATKGSGNILKYRECVDRVLKLTFQGFHDFR